jgi:threonine dehydrogenase-like Zn-dependent dehydrogenase
MNEILNGTRPYPLSLPLVPGGTALGRVSSIGPDTTSLAPGQLVFCDVTIRARDDPSTSFLFGIHGGLTPATKKLMDGEWRNATWAEYAKFPLENLYPIDEDLVIKGMGYSIPELTSLSICAVPFGGLSEIDVKPGQTVMVAPATGYYGGAAVTVAIAMGARVIAAGRNATKLSELEGLYSKTGRFRTVVLKSDAETDTATLMAACWSPKGADAYIDLSPPAAASSTHITSCLSALRSFGRCVLMGGILDNISLSYPLIMFKNLRVQGRFMFEREHVERLIKLVEAGNLEMGKEIGMTKFEKFGLEEWEKAVDAAAKQTGWGSQVLLTP